jgi:hypothetical protein
MHVPQSPSGIPLTLIGDTHAGRSSTVNNDFLVCEVTASGTHSAAIRLPVRSLHHSLSKPDNSRHNRRKSDSAGALDIIVEARNLVLVLLQKTLGVCQTEVLKLGVIIQS